MKAKILAISGSLRRESYNTAILNTLADAVADVATVEIFSLEGLAFYNQDDDTATPPARVRALRQAIADADGIVIASPEFNYGMPGVLKNALDWASRPYARSTLIGKPVLTLTSSPAFTGGVRAQSSLTETLLAIAARPVLRPQTVIGLVHEKVKDGRLVDEATLGFLKDAFRDLMRDVAKPASVALEKA